MPLLVVGNIVLVVPDCGEERLLGLEVIIVHAHQLFP